MHFCTVCLIYFSYFCALYNRNIGIAIFAKNGIEIQLAKKKEEDEDEENEENRLFLSMERKNYDRLAVECANGWQSPFMPIPG